MRSLILFLLLGSAISLAAQNTFTVNGRLKVEGSDLGGARMVIMKDGEKERTVTSDLGRFSLDLDIGHKYILEFQKDGFVTKKLLFNTNAPAQAAANGFTPFEFAVSLFKQYDDVNIVVFNQPVGIIRFEPGMDDFDYDTDYTKSIQSQLNAVMDEMAQREKDAAKNEKELAKLAAAEEKAQAKEQAQAEKERKEAEALAAEEKRQAAETAERLKKEEAEKAAAQAKAEKEAQEPPPPVVAKVEEKPEPRRPAPTPVVSNALTAKATAGEDGRRSIAPNMESEESRMAAASTKTDEEEEPVVTVPVSEVTRYEDLQIEPGKVTTVIKLEGPAGAHEYKRIVHKWGGLFYFKDGEAISRELYEREALSDRLVQAGE